MEIQCLLKIWRLLRGQFFKKILIMGRKNWQMHQKSQNFWMFSSMNDSCYMVLDQEKSSADSIYYIGFTFGYKKCCCQDISRTYWWRKVSLALFVCVCSASVLFYRQLVTFCDSYMRSIADSELAIVKENLKQYFRIISQGNVSTVYRLKNLQYRYDTYVLSNLWQTILQSLQNELVKMII